MNKKRRNFFFFVFFFFILKEWKWPWLLLALNQIENETHTHTHTHTHTRVHHKGIWRDGERFILARLINVIRLISLPLNLTPREYASSLHHQSATYSRPILLLYTMSINWSARSSSLRLRKTAAPCQIRIEWGYASKRVWKLKTK